MKIFHLLLIFLSINIFLVNSIEKKIDFKSYVNYDKENKVIKLLEFHTENNFLVYLNLENYNDLHMQIYFGQWKIENNTLQLRIDVYKESSNNEFIDEFDSRKYNKEAIIINYDIVKKDDDEIELNNKKVIASEKYNHIIDKIQNNFIENDLKYKVLKGFNLFKEGPRSLIDKLL